MDVDLHPHCIFSLWYFQVSILDVLMVANLLTQKYLTDRQKILLVGYAPWEKQELFGNKWEPKSPAVIVCFRWYKISSTKLNSFQAKKSDLYHVL